MNPFRSTSARFHKKLLTKTMAIGVILALMGTACLIQLANVQLVNGKSMAQAAAQSRTITVTLKASRGKIMDTNGSILAQSVERYTIIGNPEEAQDFTPTTCTKQTGDNCHQIDGKPVGATGAAAVARLLAPVLDMDATELGAMLSGTGQYAVLKKDVTPAVKRKISKLNLGGIVYADAVTTVSDTYAEEIKTPFYGEGLDGLLRARSHDLRGIVNGIDYGEFNPETDKNIVKAYNAVNFRKEKVKNKRALQEELGLRVDDKKMMIGLVSRLTDQKGLDLKSSHLPHQIGILIRTDRHQNIFRLLIVINLKKLTSLDLL